MQADAAALPFADGEFDVVTSSAGAIFAPDHQAAADELVRVCRPGGTIGLLTFTPEGMAGEFFELFGRYAPPPEPGEQDPILWGVEEHVRELFGDRARAPVHARHVRRARARRTARAARLLQADLRPGDRDLREPRRRPAARSSTASRSSSPSAGTPDARRPAELPVEYLLIVGRRD